MLCAPLCPRQVFPSQLGFGGIGRADHVVGFQSCAAHISLLCAPLSVSVSQGWCQPIAASSGMGSPLKSPPNVKDVRLGSLAMVFVT